jgi:predicted nucleic acid-binding Zn ribbon protein
VNYNSLKQHWKLQKEVHELIKSIERLQNKPSKIVSDTVTGSSRVNPHQECIITITGLDQRARLKSEELQSILDERRNRLENSILEVERFINTVTCSDIRQIIDLHIRRGLSWNATAVKVYGHPCGDTARMALKRYIKKFEGGLHGRKRSNL